MIFDVGTNIYIYMYMYIYMGKFGDQRFVLVNLQHQSPLCMHGTGFDLIQWPLQKDNVLGMLLRI
jgi:hypothetical protein